MDKFRVFLSFIQSMALEGVDQLEKSVSGLLFISIAETFLRISNWVALNIHWIDNMRAQTVRERRKAGARSLNFESDYPEIAIANRQT